MFNMEEDFIILFGKMCLGFVLGTLILLGIIFIMHLNDFPLKVKYYENNIEIEAIEYHNEIYLKKGE